MGGLIAGLHIALSGLQAQQAVMSVTANNVANADNPNYALQEIDLAPNPAYSPPALDQPHLPAEYGQGVTVAGVTREVSHFLQLQGWATGGQLGFSQEQAQVLGQVQALLDEPSSNGLGNTLNQFWSSWQSLAANPQSTAARTQVISAGQALGSGFSTLSEGLTTLSNNLDASVVSLVGQVNQVADQIATLNQQIGAAHASGTSPNDLEDQRDTLIATLSQLVPVRVAWSANGETTVTTGGVDMVAGNQVTQLVATPDPANHNYHTLSWMGGGAADVSGGQLGAMLTLRDQTVPGYVAQLNTLAQNIASAVNGQQSAGADASGQPVAGTANADFFSVPTGGLNASNLVVNQALVADPNELAAAANPSGGPGDGSNALAIANLQNQAIVGVSTASGAYSALVGQVGTDTATAQSASAQQQTLQQSITNQQQQVSGVSTDAEMTQMVEAQNAYAAAAKVTSTIDTMLGDLISMA